ncbi:MAG TPA: hypothetical protein DEQ84_07730 [Prevotellaceae bacterium]|nr:hypothetical protein [Prevotellaceae bacterium]
MSLLEIAAVGCKITENTIRIKHFALKRALQYYIFSAFVSDKTFQDLKKEKKSNIFVYLIFMITFAKIFSQQELQTNHLNNQIHI